MPIPPSDQPIEKLREAAIDQLVMNYGHDKLSMEAFDRRLEQAMDAKTHEQLTALTEDLELSVDHSYIKQKRETFGGEFDQDDRKEVEYFFNVMGGSNRRGEWEVPKEIRMINVMGGGELDFTDAKFPDGITKLRLYCFMGGASIFVPDGIKVKSKVFSFMGGFSDRSPSSTQANCPTLIIEGFMFMGGADVKVKKSFKQRLLEFGNSIKSFIEPDNNNVRSINERR
jgi:hypothetical protein